MHTVEDVSHLIGQRRQQPPGRVGNHFQWIAGPTIDNVLFLLPHLQYELMHGGCGIIPSKACGRL